MGWPKSAVVRCQAQIQSSSKKSPLIAPLLVLLIVVSLVQPQRLLAAFDS